ncbi:hypothetical protein WCT78_08270 [Pectobacterium versatile]|uniref:hypothetical protein n=1 Tax=Pectobacterium versatile TaxID=2488639 RepID=UPI0015DECB14|nr:MULTISPECIES: hypothetical protein [Pectobacterium]MBA0172704.1 hypothetical protein [Pectobacterium versatile]MBD0847280.1 hypothetical protein [Pectobacterium carotovorum subsp. carotovorum]MBK4826294.1 hypothetical protein [Pectobacterium carotovorum subsp. carotovorum]MCA6937753.1 hypothetical protein [Pectobacterium versatile]UNE77648.1 hypothetical protein IMY97_11580 [Pectobacterium versatile]
MQDALYILDAGVRALASTNEILGLADKDFRVAQLTTIDLEWCIAHTRNTINTHQLPWAKNGGVLENPDTFNFSFKLLDTEDRPAAACMCSFCPRTEWEENGEHFDEGPTLNVEMLQNFHLRDSELDGNTLKYALYTVLFFIVETECTGVRLIEPINDIVANYYLAQGFEDITGGSKAILWRSSENLLQWFSEEIQLANNDIEGEYFLGDNEFNESEFNGGENGN